MDIWLGFGGKDQLNNGIILERHMNNQYIRDEIITQGILHGPVLRTAENMLNVLGLRASVPLEVLIIDQSCEVCLCDLIKPTLLYYGHFDKSLIQLISHGFVLHLV